MIKFCQTLCPPNHFHRLLISFKPRPSESLGKSGAVCHRHQLTCSNLSLFSTILIILISSNHCHHHLRQVNSDPNFPDSSIEHSPAPLSPIWLTKSVIENKIVTVIHKSSGFAIKDPGEIGNVFCNCVRAFSQ